MDKFLAKCGCNCTDCPTYKDNLNTIEERKNCSAGWSKYLNIKLSPEKLRPCYGCSIKDSERKVYYLNCKVRKCCCENDFDNCAYCSVFPCDELKLVHSLQNIQTREEFILETGKEIPNSDFLKFIEPYCGIKHLNEIRKNLKGSEIKDFKKFSNNIKFIEFPEQGQIIGGRINALKKIYSFLTSVDIQSNISYVKHISLKERRKLILRILWAIALHGELKRDKKFIELDGKTFSSQKIPGVYYQTKLIEYFDILNKYNFHCNLFPENIKEWLTPGGYIKANGWSIRMSYGDYKDTDVLETLQNYAVKLNKSYQKNWFQRFNSANLNVMFT